MPVIESKINEVDEQSEFIKEAMAQPPKWIFRYSISLFFILICTILFLSNYIKYPDILTADMGFIDRTGLKEHLAPTRANALTLMANQMKQRALEFASL